MPTLQCLGSMVFGLRVKDYGFRVQSQGSRNQGQGLIAFGIQGFGVVRVQGLGFRVAVTVKSSSLTCKACPLAVRFEPHAACALL